ncbi:TonB-dependent receptor [Pseudohaliea sp.]|uniref:TonB-dependent receptor n=1 Tax=Pseudohaliea sp. TaxID=2740289 RepID=UPI0032ED7EE7
MNLPRTTLHSVVKTVIGTLAASTAAFSVPGHAQQSSASALEEVIVSARYREENLQDVPASIRAFSGDDLATLGINSVGDLSRLTPSLNVQERGPNRNEMNIRGVSNFLNTQDLVPSARPVGIYLDEVPVNTLGGSQVDIRNYDLARVEILRGPQGTLYGEGSSGGAVRYYSKDPDKTAFGAGFEVEGVSVDGGGNDVGARGFLNIPLADGKAGLRLSGGRYVMPGFIDEIGGEDDHNDFEALNFRAVLAADFSDNFSGRLMVSHDDSELGGLGLATGDRVTNLPVSDGQIDDESLVASLKLDYRFDAGTLSSITGYFDRERDRNTYDQIYSLINSFVTIPVGGFSDRAFTTDAIAYEQFTQEFRWVSSLDGPLQYTAGLFYRDLSFELNNVDVCSPTHVLVGYPSECTLDFLPVLGLPVPALLATNDGQQISAFAEVEYALSEQWTVIGGLRWHREDLDVVSNESGSLLNLQPVLLPAISEEVSIEVVLPKFALEYTPSDDLLIYAQYATGARNGNINSSTTLAAIELFAPGGSAGLESYDEDSTDAYELGLKATLLNGKATFNAAVFYTDYKDLQVLVSTPPLGFAVILNASEASSTGFEAEFSAALTDNLTVFAGGNYTESELDEDLLSNQITGEITEAGTALPNVPEWAANAGFEYSAPAFDATNWYVNGSWAYTGAYDTALGPRGVTLGEFSVFNAGVGLRSDRWSVDLLITNLTDESEIVAENNFDRVLVDAGLPIPAGDTFNEIFLLQPRTARLALRYSF